MPALSADKETIIYFTVTMSQALSPATIKVYLSAISSWYQQNGYKSPTSHNTMLSLMVKGARKQHALKSNRKSIRQPITARILKHMLQEVRNPSYHLRPGAYPGFNAGVSKQLHKKILATTPSN